MRTQHTVEIITGPTCSGKSAYALALAEKNDGVIINADAMQTYRDLPVLTAQPTPQEQAQVPHRLYGVLDGAELGTAARWVAMAAAEIRQAWEAAQMPLLVGGTGMYLKLLMEGIAEVPPVPAEIRTALRERMAQEGSLAFHGWFSARDPLMAQRLKPGDTQRLLRAAEVFEATGRSLADWQMQAPCPPLPEAEYHLTVIQRERKELYARIDQRFVWMMEHGAPEEVERLRLRGLSPELPVMRSHGVPELIACLEGRMPRAEAIAKGQQNTRNYAKRQMTWMRHQFSQAQIITLP